MKFTAFLAHKKSTKGTEVYSNPDAPITTVYIRKEALKDGIPPVIKLMVEGVADSGADIQSVG